MRRIICNKLSRCDSEIKIGQNEINDLIKLKSTFESKQIQNE